LNIINDEEDLDEELRKDFGRLLFLIGGGKKRMGKQKGERKNYELFISPVFCKIMYPAGIL